MYKVGYKVRVVNSTSVASGMEGDITEIDSSIYPVAYEVTFNVGKGWFNAIEIELITTLPIGNQMTLGTASLLMDEAYNDMPEPTAPKCDCGGYKVFGTMSSESHSPWCSIFNTKS